MWKRSHGTKGRSCDLAFPGRLCQSFNAQRTIVKTQQESLANKQFAIDSLQRADKVKNDFLSNTSHELRTPLNGIIGIAEALIGGVTGPLSEQTRKHLLLVMSSGKRLSRRIDVTDTGIGNKDENIEKIFESFEQVDTSSEREQLGTGRDYWLIWIRVNLSIALLPKTSIGSRSSVI